MSLKPPEGYVARLTEAGRKAFWASQAGSSPLPKEVRRMMGLVEFQGHPNVIRAYLRQYPDRLIDEWLDELKEAGWLEYLPAHGNPDLMFRGEAARATPPMLEEDRQILADRAWAAGNALSIVGAYVAQDRAKNRSATAKSRADIEILIVEDDPDQLALAEQRLKLAGYKTRVAESGLALRESLAASGSPDLLLLDVMLPDCDGFDVLSNLRRHPALSQLPVVMLTVKSDPADIELGLALGADAYVTKPYSKAVLAQTIEQVLGAGEAAARA